jgi:hypothetical protein
MIVSWDIHKKPITRSTQRAVLTDRAAFHPEVMLAARFPLSLSVTLKDGSPHVY